MGLRDECTIYVTREFMVQCIVRLAQFSYELRAGFL
jgi:hypothetical protein